MKHHGAGISRCHQQTVHIGCFKDCCVCVDHLNRCKTSTGSVTIIRFQQHGAGVWIRSLQPTKTLLISQWYDPGTLGSRTCFLFLRHGQGLSREHYMWLLFVDLFSFVAAWLSQSGRESILFWIISCFISQRYWILLFPCWKLLSMHDGYTPTSEFVKPSFDKCVSHVGSTRWHGPFEEYLGYTIRSSNLTPNLHFYSW